MGIRFRNSVTISRSRAAALSISADCSAVSGVRGVARGFFASARKEPGPSTIRQARIAQSSAAGTRIPGEIAFIVGSNPAVSVMSQLKVKNHLKRAERECELKLRGRQVDRFLPPV